MAKKFDYASLYTLRSDGRFMATYTDDQGKRHYVYDKDPERLWQKLNGPKDPEPLTFGTIAEAWHDARWERIRPGTQACYAAPYKRAIERFKDTPADEIFPADIGRHLLQMKEHGYSAKSIKTQRTIYHLIYQFAIADEEYGRLIRSNPADGAILPGGMKRPVKRTAPEDDVVNAIRAKAETAYWGIFCLLLISTGFRRGEALALQWKDIDFKAGTISCTKSLIYRNGTATISDTKTVNGVREVPILPDLEPALKEYKPDNASPEDYVFYGTSPTTPLPESTYRRRWHHYCKDMGFVDDDGGHTLTAHVMRHGYATMLYDAGVDAYTAQKLLGHADIQTTLAIYTHLKQLREKESLNKLKNYVAAEIKKDET